jgi:hypothetical protein
MLEVFETCPNPKGLIAVCSSKEVCVIATPDKSQGTIRVVHFDKGMKCLVINVHQSAVAAMTLNSEGTLLATASDKVCYFLKNIFILITNFCNRELW